MNHFDLLLAKKLAEQSGSGGGGGNVLLITFTANMGEGTVTCDTEPSKVFEAFENNSVIVGDIHYVEDGDGGEQSRLGFVNPYEYEEDDYYEHGYTMLYEDRNGNIEIEIDYYEESGSSGSYDLQVNTPDPQIVQVYGYWTGADGTGEWEVSSAGLAIDELINSSDSKWKFLTEWQSVVHFSDSSIMNVELIGLNLNPATDVNIGMVDIYSDRIRMGLTNSRGQSVMCNDSIWLIKLRVYYYPPVDSGGHN